MNTLYGVPLSPFVRKVMLLLAYKDIDYRMQTVIPFATPDAWARMHPQRKVPVFEDEYITLPDSSVICRYLQDKYPALPVYPDNPVNKANVLWIEEFADTALAECLAGGLFFERLVRPAMTGKPTDEARVEHTVNTLLPPLLDYLEARHAAHQWWMSETPTVADFALVSVFLNARYAGYEVDSARWPGLYAYLQRAWEQPLIARQIESETSNLADLRGVR